MNKLLLTIPLILLSVAAVPEVHEATTGLDDRIDVAVTAYNNGLALIRDARALALPTGEVRLKFEGVPEQIVGGRSVAEAPADEARQRHGGHAPPGERLRRRFRVAPG